MYKIVVADPKTKRTYQKEVAEKESGLTGRKIGEKIKGDFLGLPGFEMQITGGSDKQGFPMRQDMPGFGRRKVLLTRGTGFHALRRGERRRKLVRGNTISDEIVQVNMKVAVYGKDSLAKLFGKEEAKHEEKKAEEHKKEEAKAEHKAEHAEKTHEEAKHEGHKEEHKEAKHEEHKPEHAEAKHEHKKE
jgi:small subunit ribosomal protein S6e